jgi:N-acetylmuramoyl-L-alanine amidase
VTSSLIRYRTRKETTLIILHDSHTDPAVVGSRDVPRWQALAREGGLRMGILDIGYHFIIERNGEYEETRERHLIGSHTPGFNMESIGICLVGGRQAGGHLAEDNFTKRQWDALFGLLTELAGEFPEARLVSHSEIQKFRNKSLPDCPPVDMDDVRQELAIFQYERNNGDVGNDSAT